MRPKIEKLSERELNVLKLACYSKEEIAIKLCLSKTTIKSHINNIYCKLCVHNSAQALIKALKTGIITIDEVITNDF